VRRGRCCPGVARVGDGPQGCASDLERRVGVQLLVEWGVVLGVHSIRSTHRAADCHLSRRHSERIDRRTRLPELRRSVEGSRPMGQPASYRTRPRHPWHKRWGLLHGGGPGCQQLEQRTQLSHHFKAAHGPKAPLHLSRFGKEGSVMPQLKKSSSEGQRRRAIQDARHASELEGGQSTSDTRRDQDAYVRGEIDVTQLGARVKSRYGLS